MTDYVLGFLFTKDLNNVVLIEKQKPDWQKGLWNGVGGKVEDGESSDKAMQREFKEETDLNIKSWERCILMEFPHCTVMIYKAVSDKAWKAETKEEGIVKVVPVGNLDLRQCIPNLHWIIPLLLDPVMKFPMNMEGI